MTNRARAAAEEKEARKRKNGNANDEPATKKTCTSHDTDDQESSIGNVAPETHVSPTSTLANKPSPAPQDAVDEADVLGIEPKLSAKEEMSRSSNDLCEFH